MKKLLLLIILAAIGTTFIHAQNYQLKGLEIYNPVYSNPAFTSSDKILQTDLIAYDVFYNNGYWLNAMSSIPNSKSSVGLNFGGGKYFKNYSFSGKDRSAENISLRANSIGLSYAYTHSFTEQLKLSGGINFTHSILNFPDTTTRMISRNTGFLNAGLKLNYRKLYVGISAGRGLYKRDKELSAANEISVAWESLNSFSSNGIAGYSLGGNRRVNFDPVIGYMYRKDLGSGNSDFGLYAGANITIVKTVGLGFTVGDMYSISTSITVLDRVSLMLGIYQIEGNSIYVTGEYALRFDPLSFIAQLRIKL